MHRATKILRDHRKAVEAVCVSAFVILAGVLVWQVLGERADPGVALSQHVGFADFRDTVWLPVRDLLHGHDPYDPTPYLARHPGSQELDLYSPAALLLHAPLALLPFPIACVIWIALLFLAALWVSRMCLVAADLPRTLGPICTLAFLLCISTGGHNLLVTGQIGGEVAIGAWLAVLYARSPEPTGHRLAVIGTVLALQKPQTGIPLIVLLAALGAWPVLRRGLAWSLALIAPGLVMLLSIDGPIGLVHVIRRNLDYSLNSTTLSAGSPGNLRVDLTGVIANLHGHDLPGVVSVAITVVILGLACWACSRIRTFSECRGGVLNATLALGLTMAIFLSLVHAPYDELIMFGPMVAIAALTLRSIDSARWWRGAAVVLLLAVFLRVLERFSAHVLPASARLDGHVIAVIDTAVLVVALTAALWGELKPRTGWRQSLESAPAPTL